jgi:hypothetical protein
MSAPSAAAVVSITRWKSLLLVLVPVLAGLHLWALTNWHRYAAPNGRGTLALTLGEADREFRLPIESMAADSPLARVGAKPGDRIVFDRHGDALRQLGIDETIGVTLFTGARTEHAFVTPVAVSTASTAAYSLEASESLLWLSVAITLAIGALIGWRRASSGAMRVLSLALMSGCVNFFAYRLPAGPIQDWCVKLLWPIAFYAAFVGLPYFALSLPDEAPLLRNVYVRRLFYFFSAAWLVFTAHIAVERFGALSWMSLPPVSELTGNILQLCTALIAICAPWVAWRRSTGEMKQRVAWIGVCLGGTYVVIAIDGILIDLVPATSGLIQSGLLKEVSVGLEFLCCCGLGYAALRHRIFDFGFAINRALVYAIISSVLLLTFGITEWGLDKLLHFRNRESSAILDAIVAVAIIFSFHRIEHWASRRVNQVFFRQWHDAAESLRVFMNRATHIWTEGALQAKFVQALDQFKRASGTAIYALQTSSGFQLQTGTLAGAPATIDPDDDMAIEMRRTRRPIDCVDASNCARGGFAFPVIVRGTLTGIVLLGPKLAGELYRPDEIELLASCVHQFGLDLESLRISELERRNASLRQRDAELQLEVANLKAQNAHMKPMGGSA